jgi:hypothetical protein
MASATSEHCSPIAWTGTWRASNLDRVVTLQALGETFPFLVAKY